MSILTIPASIADARETAQPAVKSINAKLGNASDLFRLVALNAFTNSPNEVAKTDIDFPAVTPSERAA